MIFGENSAKYQAYRLTFWRKFAHFSHFSLYNQNQSSWFLVKIRQNTKPIALLFGKNFANFSHFSLYNQNQSSWFLVNIWQNTKAIALLFGENSPILATFHSTIKISQVDFLWKFGKITSLLPYFLPKIRPF